MAHRFFRVGLTIAVLAIDQTSKHLARSYLSEPTSLAPFLDLRLGFNTGVSFGFFAGGSDFGRWILVAGTSAVALWILVWLWRESRLAVAAPLALIAGGALGNIADRVRMGGVTDFIDAHAGSARWPTFNLADTAITIGVAWLLLTTLRRQAPLKSSKDGPS